MIITEFFLIYSLGALLYGAIELIWRGWTHWSMLLCGGLCFYLLYAVSSLELGFVKKLILSAAGISTVEFFTGCLVNLRMGWQVWDYSSLRFNLLGQICPQFSLMWLLLSIPGLWLCRLLRSLLP